MRRTWAPLVLLAAFAPASSPLAAPAPADASPAAKWIDPTGDGIVGFGLLRVVPPRGGGTFRVHYTENPGEYAASDQYQLFVLPGDAFATKTSAYASEYLAFARTDPAKADGTADLAVDFRAAAETTVLVCYGPWTAPDAGRPPGDTPAFRLDVTSLDPAGAFEWVESEMGELVTTNWTGRPMVERGKPTKDPVTGADAWFEVRPMILYDGRMVRSADDPLPNRLLPATIHDDAYSLDGQECSADGRSQASRSDRRIVMARELVEKFRRVPIRWR